MTRVGFMWECECGHIALGDKSPEECPKCFRLDSFTKLPEEIAREREKDIISDEEEYE